MNVTILRMLSTNSLSAFSAATITPAQKSRPASVRLVRETSPASGFGVQKNAVPKPPPGVAPPRGSLLNLSV